MRDAHVHGMLLPILFICLLGVHTALATHQQLAPLHLAEDTSQRVENEYLVLLRPNIPRPLWEAQVVSLQSSFIAAADGSEVKRMYAIGNAFHALHVRLSPMSLNKVRAHPDVALVEENQVVRTAEACHQQKNVSWNLGRIDTHDISDADENYSYRYTGANVDVYIIDTGIMTTHVEFEGRAEWGANFADSEDADLNGHGTHVAGIVAGHRYGVAKKAAVIAVKALGRGGTGSWDAVISGVQWAADQARTRRRPSVANMSLSGGRSPTTNAAVAAAVGSGVTFTVAAGNEYTDACRRSPAMEPKAITVAATYVVDTNDTALGGMLTAKRDRRAAFSNYGTCVNIAAPGKHIRSAWINQEGSKSDAGYRTLSGTSMASPHAAGVAALVLSRFADFGPEEVAALLYKEATDGVIDLACGRSKNDTACAATPNRLLYTNC